MHSVGSKKEETAEVEGRQFHLWFSTLNPALLYLKSTTENSCAKKSSLVIHLDNPAAAVVVSKVAAANEAVARLSHLAAACCGKA
jgi:hypothetical protein